MIFMSNNTRIQYVNLQKQWLDERDELLPIIDKVLEKRAIAAFSKIPPKIGIRKISLSIKALKCFILRLAPSDSLSF